MTTRSRSVEQRGRSMSAVCSTSPTDLARERGIREGGRLLAPAGFPDAAALSRDLQERFERSMTTPEFRERQAQRATPGKDTKEQPSTAVKGKPETWRDWQAADAPEPEPAALLTRDELLAALARMRDIALTDARLHDWETQGALPHPVRRYQRGAVRGLYAPWCVDLAFYAVRLHAESDKPVAALRPLTRLAARHLSRLPVSAAQAAHRASLGLPIAARVRLWNPFSPDNERPPEEFAAIEQAVSILARPHIAAGIMPYRVRIAIDNQQGPPIEYEYTIGLCAPPTATPEGGERRGR